MPPSPPASHAPALKSATRDVDGEGEGEEEEEEEASDEDSTVGMRMRWGAGTRADAAASMSMVRVCESSIARTVPSRMLHESHIGLFGFQGSLKAHPGLSRLLCLSCVSHLRRNLFAYGFVLSGCTKTLSLANRQDRVILIGRPRPRVR